MMATAPVVDGEDTTNEFGFTKGDRLLLKSYFGYLRCKQLPNVELRPSEDASPAVKKILWSPSDQDDEEFDLENLTRTKCEITPLFDMNVDIFKQMILEAKNFNSTQQCAILKSFTVSKKKRKKR